MATSGTYTFNPSLGDMTLFCYNLAGIRRTEIIQEHLAYAAIAANKVCLDWSNKGVNLWKVVGPTAVPWVQGQATYSIDPSCIVMLDTYAQLVGPTGITTDLIMTPISRSEYATYPDKQAQGRPTVYWYNRQINPSVTVWNVPDGTSSTNLVYFWLRQIQDSVLGGSIQEDMPARWLPAFIDAYAVELARAWNPPRVKDLLVFAQSSYATAANQDVETSNIYISPQLSGYWRM